MTYARLAAPLSISANVRRSLMAMSVHHKSSHFRHRRMTTLHTKWKRSWMIRWKKGRDGIMSDGRTMVRVTTHGFARLILTQWKCFKDIGMAISLLIVFKMLTRKGKERTQQRTQLSITFIFYPALNQISSSLMIVQPTWILRNSPR